MFERLEQRVQMSVNVPVGPAVRANDYVAGLQFEGSMGNRSIAADAAGNFVVVWESSGQDGAGGTFGGRSVYGRLFAADGTPRGSEFRVNTYLDYDQMYATVAMDADGDFVVAWESGRQDGSGEGIYAQRFDPSGNRKGGEFRVNTYTSGDQMIPSVAADDSGNFAIAWRSPQDPNKDGVGIYAKRYDAAGNVLPSPYASTGAGGGEFRVNTYTPNGQANPQIAMDSDGDMVVTWVSDGQDSSGFGIYAQRFARTGAKAGGEFRVNQATAGDQYSSTVAMDAAGNFTVGWFNGPWFGSGVRDIYFRRFAADGTPQSDETKANTTSGLSQTAPNVAMDRQSGAFLVTWQGGTGGGWIRQYDPSGNAQGDPTPAGGLCPQAAWQPGGAFALAYDSPDAGGSQDVFVQRYEPPVLATSGTSQDPFGTTAIADPLPPLSPADSILGLDQPLFA